MRSLTKMEQKIATQEKRVKSLREQTKAIGKVGKRFAVGSVAAGLTGFVGARFLTGDGESFANIRGIPVEPLAGFVSLGVGLYADSDALVDAGLGIVNGAAHDLGKHLAVLSLASK